MSSKGHNLSNARRLVDMSSSPPVPTLPALPPEADLGLPEVDIYPVTTTHSAPRRQVVTRCTSSIATGRLVDFAVMLQQSDSPDDDWRDLVRIDTSHREVHFHDNREYAGSEPICIPEECRPNIDRAYDWAKRQIWELASPARGDRTLWNHDA